MWQRPGRFENKNGVIVLLDSVGPEGRKTFAFFPVRRIRTRRLFKEGNALYIDFRFGEFLNYGSGLDSARKDAWSRFFEGLETRPWPPPSRSGRDPTVSEGYFVFDSPDKGQKWPTENAISHEAWENLVRRLDQSTDLRGSTFFHVVGLFRTGRRLSFFGWRTCVPLPVIGRAVEVRIQSGDYGYDSVYSVPMGKGVVLKLLLSRPSYEDTPESRRRLDVRIGSEMFAGASKEAVYSESRYNEERLILVVKRVFDSFMSRISIEQANEGNNVQAPRPFLLTAIKVPRYIVLVVVSGVALTAMLAGLDGDSIALLGTWVRPENATWWHSNGKTVATIAKLVSALPISVSAYLAFKRLPVK